jgi:Nuclease-related domain
MAHHPAHWPDDPDQEDPPVGVTIRPLHRLPVQLPDPTIPPLAADTTHRGGSSYGTPGRSALAHYRHLRAAEWAAFLRTLPWRLAAITAAGLITGVLVRSHNPHPTVAGTAAALAAGGLGWLLRFRVSMETSAWRRGSRGERRTARRLRKLERSGWSILHDVAIPHSHANGDHLLIGPAGVFLVDSKAWHGTIRLAPDGSAWYGVHPLAPMLATVRWEADQLAAAISAPVTPMVCVHDTQIPWGELYYDNVPVLDPDKLVTTLRALPPLLEEVQVALLTEQARRQLHPAV